jgi:serine/threonine-protein kinase
MVDVTLHGIDERLTENETSSDSSAPPDPSDVGREFGHFRAVEFIGSGGTGIVYRAERTDGVRQRVALKLVSGELGSALRRRFERETQLLARLEHPAIARLIDAGFQEGRAWIAMEFVRGERIDAYCSAHALAPRDIARLMLSLTEAVGVAHGSLVVHRDIKPANVLVAADGLPKLVDFGIATALRITEETTHAPTVNLNRMFSPHFAAPEQVTGGPITVATDIFGLGALAYRLLTGVVPHADAGGPLEYLVAVTERDVALPSRAALAAGREIAAVRALRGDLDAIVSKALERDPSRRYGSAAEMRADWQRYLDRQPVIARTPSPTYRLGKFVRRNALAVSLSALLAVSLVLGGVIAVLQAHRAATARDMAARRGEFLESVLRSTEPRADRRNISVAELLDAAGTTLEEKLGNEPLVEASMLGLIADTNDGLGRYPQGLAASERELALLEAHGGTALEIGRALTSKAELLREEARWAEAEPILRQALPMLRRLHARAELVAALDLLGIVLSHTYREREAEATFLEEIALESDGDEAVRNRRIYPYQALEGTFMDQGRYAEAESYGRQALDLARQTLPPDHPDLLAIEAQYGSVLVNSGRAAQAEPILRDVIVREIRTSGAGHKDTLMIQGLLADALIVLHRDAEAASLARATASQLEPLLGAKNYYTLNALQSYGVASCNIGAVDEGLAVMRRVQKARSLILPAGDRLVATADLGTGLCLYRARRYDEAESTLLRAAAALEAARGPRYRRTQEAYRALRDLYAATDREPDAARFSGKIISGFGS